MSPLPDRGARLERITYISIQKDERRQPQRQREDMDMIFPTGTKHKAW